MLWAITDSPRQNAQARSLILDPQIVFTSHRIGVGFCHQAHARSERHADIEYPSRSPFQAAGYTELPVVNAHFAMLETLPPHHTDPFDRLLVAQGLAEPLRLLTHDASVSRYSDSIILV